ncbi:HK97 gp10 family phage protein [Microvirga sp. SRT01]|uniref:HK97 gp10 family phage protein n=1 Tax=Sphingomonas longa TaxID=2778730 RepID=A0ABS2D846_9SPHN|nr:MULTISPECIES: HK97-gp10 family putative phage morphogenesis protein [Alphaproteobacteria]MBM6577118.1 HK97 gp10 family phage protein [Sphingomonas sp. BT552]MBR7710162.1 HK97 gp10 family phage protein [Microvirga sp. SRT01]
MVNRSNFSMEGFSDLEKVLKDLGPPFAKKAGSEGLRKATNELKKDVQAGAPTGTARTKRTWRNKDGTKGSADYGRLKQNIKTRKRRSKKQNTIVYVVTTGDAFWGRFSEFGTEKEPARPWFKPAVDRSVSRIVKALKDELHKAVEKQVRKARG